MVVTKNRISPHFVPFRRYIAEDKNAKIFRNPRSGIEEEAMRG
jgi:hypothetical protein